MEKWSVGVRLSFVEKVVVGGLLFLFLRFDRG